MGILSRILDNFDKAAQYRGKSSAKSQAEQQDKERAKLQATIMQAPASNDEATISMNQPEENVIVLALQKCDKVFVQERQLLEIETQLKTLNSVRKNLLDIEEDALKKVNANIEKLAKQAAVLQEEIRLGPKYRRLDLSVFKMRDQYGWPRLALFSLHSSLCEIKAKKIYSEKYAYVIFPVVLPQEIHDLYEDVRLKLRPPDDSYGGSYKSIAMKFEGVIPLKVKEQINKAREDFGDNIFIVSEARWQLKEYKAPPPSPDPLVIGWGGNEAWLITAFDITTLENYIASEFTS